MNKRGQVAIFTLMIGIVIILLGISFAPGIKTQIDSVRGTTGLDCANSSISKFDKATCISTDLTMFYFIAGIVFLGGAVVAAKKFIG